MVWQSWRSAWHEALYGPDGFYRQPVGPAGHFATSAQGIPGGGRLLARAVGILAERSRCRRIVDVGAGRGELLRELSALQTGWEFTGVDVVDRPDGLPADVGWLTAPGGSTLPAALCGLQDTLVLAHEWLDVVPCSVVEYDGRVWREVDVDPCGAERLAGPAPETELLWLERHGPASPRHGDRAEVGITRDEAYRQLRDRLHSGMLVVVDYGHTRATRPRSGTLTGFRQGMQCLPLPDGSTDITAHVAMDTLGAGELLRQRDIFEQLGLRPQQPDIAWASTDPPAYLRALAERSGYTQLTATGGLGDFWWAIDRIG
ncbi:SAM-dependent methyltransferase [Flexivirga sp.]|uniref:SAM-dependent methyltransferase n=1 Tax=Flexivirga sp. TaxID=1962927 RepID=UPI003F7EFAFF